MKSWNARAHEVAYLLNPAFCGRILYIVVKTYGEKINRSLIKKPLTWHKKNFKGAVNLAFFPIRHLTLPVLLAKSNAEFAANISIATQRKKQKAIIMCLGFVTQEKRPVPAQINISRRKF